VGRLGELGRGGDIKNLSASVFGIVRTFKIHGGKRKPKPKPKDGDRAVNDRVNDVGGNDDDDGGGGGGGDKAVVEQDDSAMVACFTGRPHPDDTVLYCVPILAPYASLSTMNFRVKITPGSSKPLKTAKAAVEYFMNLNTANCGGGKKGGVPREFQAVWKRNQGLFESITEQELSSTMIGDVQMVTGKGGMMVKKKAQRGQKSKKK